MECSKEGQGWDNKNLPHPKHGRVGWKATPHWEKRIRRNRCQLPQLVHTATYHEKQARTVTQHCIAARHVAGKGLDLAIRLEAFQGDVQRLVQRGLHLPHAAAAAAGGHAGGVRRRGALAKPLVCGFQSPDTHALRSTRRSRSHAGLYCVRACGGCVVGGSEIAVLVVSASPFR